MKAYPDKEPKPEAFASRHTGVQLEELSGLAASQDYASDGPWLSYPAQELLLSFGNGSRPGRFGLRGKEDALGELEQAGLATAKGKLTGEGRLITSVLENPVASFVISGGLRGARTSLQCILGAEGILMLAGASCASLRNGSAKSDETARQLDFLSLDQLPTALVAWVGLGPAWALDGNGTPTPEQLQARMDGASAEQVPPPPDADAVFRHMWEQDWFVWQVAGEGMALPTGIHAGPAGTWKMTRTETGIALGAWPSGSAYRDLLASIAGLLPGQAAGGPVSGKRR